MAGTRCINGRELRQMYEKLGARKTTQLLEEALEQKHLRPDDFSIREMAENLVKDGPEWVRSLQPKKSGFHLLEAGTVDYSHFSNITGQIFFTMMKDAYTKEDFVFSKVVPTKTSTILDMEKIPGIGDMGDKFTTPIEEGEAYPHLAVVEDYIAIGPKAKRGGIVAVTKEAIAADKTGFLLDRCQKIGWFLGYNKEKRIIDALIDGNDGAVSAVRGGHRLHWKDTSYASYQASSPWINVKTGTALSSWTSVEAAELVLAAITDPYTGEPIMVEPTHLIVPPDLKHTASRIMKATNVQTHAGGYATTGNLQDYHAPSPLDPYKILTSRLFKTRMTAAGQTGASTWYLGSPKDALVYMEVFGLTVVQRGEESEDAFNRDVVFKVRASERGIASVIEPRFMLKATA